MRRTRRTWIAAGLVGLAGTGAWADPWGPAAGAPGTQGVAGCTRAGESALCLTLRCRPGKPLELALVASPDWPIADGPATLTFQVDATPPTAFVFRPTTEARPATDLSLTYHPDAMAPLIDRIKRGTRLNLWIGGPEAPVGVGFSLAGSGKAINTMFDGRCTLVARADPAPVPAPPVTAGQAPDGLPPPPAAPLPPAPDPAPETSAPAPAPAAAAAPAPALEPVDLGDSQEPALALARQIGEPVISAVRAIEGRAPDLRARLIDLGEGRALLFTHFCGGAYFGPTGCSGVAFAIAGESHIPIFGDGELFLTRGLSLDRRDVPDGWPSIVTDSGRRWRWTGRRYEEAG